MRPVLRPDSSGIDVLAQVGDVLRDLVAPAPRGAHHAFEALPHLAAKLRTAFPAVTVHERAVSDKPATGEFLHVENEPGYSGLRPCLYDRRDPRIVKLRVTTTRIDDVVPAEQPIAFVKIDIEVGEYHALLGAARTIQRWRPIIAFEASARSTGQYGVTPVQMYALLTGTFGDELTTMQRWLAHAPPYTSAEFTRTWHHRPDFYFLAAPLRAPRLAHA